TLIACSALLGIAVLTLRPLLFDVTWRVAAFSVMYATVGVICLAVPLPGDDLRPLPRWVVAAVGLSGGVMTRLNGDAVPLPRTSCVLILGSLAAVSEELLFRRLVYGGLRTFGAAAAIGGSALLFALVHLPIYGPAAFPVDLGAGLLF